MQYEDTITLMKVTAKNLVKFSHTLKSEENLP